MADDIAAIETQILFLAKEGHDVQLHLHPHWLDATYENDKWNFTYKRFKLQTLSGQSNAGDINTVIGCISIAKKILEDLIRQVNPNYKVTTFRAGGYLIQPFSKLKDAMLQNGILIDTSICPGLKNDNDIFSFDFSSYPNSTYYRFTDDPLMVADNGSFTEIPIHTVKIPAYLNIYFAILKRLKYQELNTRLKGTGSWQTTNVKPRNLTSKLKGLSEPQLRQFTTDSNFKEILNYMFKKAGENTTLILHPKLLNDHVINYLTQLVTNREISFISTEQYIALINGARD